MWGTFSLNFFCFDFACSVSTRLLICTIPRSAICIINWFSLFLEKHIYSRIIIWNYLLTYSQGKWYGNGIKPGTYIPLKVIARFVYSQRMSKESEEAPLKWYPIRGTQEISSVPAFPYVLYYTPVCLNSASEKSRWNHNIFPLRVSWRLENGPFR